MSTRQRWSKINTNEKGKKKIRLVEENRAKISQTTITKRQENQHLWWQKNLQDLPRIVPDQPRSKLYQNRFSPFLEESAYILPHTSDTWWFGNTWWFAIKDSYRLKRQILARLVKLGRWNLFFRLVSVQVIYILIFTFIFILKVENNFSRDRIL